MSAPPTRSRGTLADAVLEAAERYIAVGLSVFLVAPGSKKPPHGSAGFKDATADVEEVRRGLERIPGAGLAVATGEVSGCWVLDVDESEEKDGLATLEALEDEYGELPETWVSETPRGGRHYWFAWPDDGTTIKSRAGVLEGLDTRGNGGYVVVPPTMLDPTDVHPGGGYRWSRGRAPGEIPLARAPVWLRKRVTKGLRSVPEKPPGGEGEIREGTRNDTLARIAGRLRRKGLSVDEMDAVLQNVNRGRCKPPLSREEVTRIARSIVRYPPGRAFVEVGEDPATVTLDDLSEKRGADRLVRRLEGRFRYCAKWGRWLHWDGSRWTVDPGHFVSAEARDLCEELNRLGGTAAARTGGARAAGVILRAARRVLERSYHEHVLRYACEAERLALDPSLLDRHPLLLNTPSGVVDLSSGEVRPHDPALLLTKITRCEFDPGAEAPRFQDFLRDVFADDLELLAFVQRAFGYSLTGEMREQKFFLALGSGANGKTTLLEVVRYVLGDYGAATPFSTFLSSDRNTIPNDLARLRGARFITASEPERGRRFHEGRLKEWTGGDPVTARFLRQEFFTFRPEGKLWFSANYRPNVADDSDGFWRRCLVVPFVVSFSEEQQDPRLPEKLRAEAPGILRWAVEGARLWHERGLRPPPVVRKAVQEYRSSEDVLGQFLDECCVVGPGRQELASRLYAAYQRWAETNGFSRPLTQQGFGRRLGDRGFCRHKEGGAWHRVGVQLRGDQP